MKGWIIMKKYKQLIIGMVIGVLFTIPALSFAEDGLEQIKALIRKDLTIVVDGVKTEFENPIISYEGRTYLYLRDFEKFGFIIDWNGELKQIDIDTVTNSVYKNNKSDLIPNIEIPVDIDNMNPNNLDNVFDSEISSLSFEKIVTRDGTNSLPVAIVMNYNGEMNTNEFFAYWNNISDIENILINISKQISENYPNQSVYISYYFKKSNRLAVTSVSKDGVVTKPTFD